ncbi:hypothetical protein CLNEO_07040 [Anaerotignum neopropionicum]|uniref:Uncharacterized protein n=1 Tax=Anaerotignum neopropionicum TaxID=36847 RepID=A0A136WFZ8_9FIRM|nr:hypothetical protein CLNEO_07040 [Anaerotignum neopropionicum]
MKSALLFFKNIYLKNKKDTQIWNKMGKASSKKFTAYAFLDQNFGYFIRKRKGNYKLLLLLYGIYIMILVLERRNGGDQKWREKFLQNKEAII